MKEKFLENNMLDHATLKWDKIIWALVTGVKNTNNVCWDIHVSF